MAETLRTQANRSIAINTPLGEDKVAIQSIRGREEFGRMFQYELELLSEDDTINFDDLLGKNVTVRIGIGSDGPDVRYVNGFVNRISQHEYRAGLAAYKATIVPWLWFLTRQSDCRIFQEQSIPDIVKKVMKDVGFSDIDDRLSSNYETREYCVQYRETTFNFISRLLEQEGIYYYFEHENGLHKMVLCDSSDAHQPLEDGALIPYYPPDRAMRNEQHIRTWSVQKQMESLEYELADFDFVNPGSPVVSKSTKARDYASGPWEAMFDYPGEYVSSAEAEHFATIRLQELQARYEMITGQSDHLGMVIGGRFELTIPVKGLRPDQAREYILTSTSLQATQDLFSSGNDSGDEDFYSLGFSVLPATEAYRPARTTPKPVVQGPQTAIVAGKSGEEIWTDEHGRVKLQFHWDRYSKGDEVSSCWVRVSQNWAGKRWGVFFLPRIGQEVIVEFLEGDPDRPIITGRVYNGQNLPPYKPNAMGTISTIKSNSSKGGGGFNEIRFEDKKDEEQVFIHAQKNMDIRVLNDRFETVVNDRHLVVENDKHELVKNDRDEKVEGAHREFIAKDRSLKVEGKENKLVVDEQSLTVKADVHEVYEMNQSVEVTEKASIKADIIVLEGATNVTLKVGDSFIAIDSSGIKIGTTGAIALEADGDITGTSSTGAVTMEASGGEFSASGAMAAKLTSDLQTDVTGAMVSVSGDSMTEVKGGVVMIN